MSIDLRRYALRGCLLVALLLGACATPTAEKAQPEPATLRVVLLPFLSHAPFFIAEEEGYFAEQGLRIEFVRLARLVEAIPTLAEGDLDVVGGALDVALLNAIARGAKIKFVADKGYISATGCAYCALMATKALVEGRKLDSPAQLQGRRISVLLPAFSGYLVEKLLNRVHLTLNDVEILDIADNLEPEALEKGTIDVAVTSEPWIARILRAGQAVVWMSAQEVIPDFQFGVIVYGPTLLERNPDAGRRFMVAYLKAVRRFNEGKTQRNLEILAKHTELDQELLKQACWPSFRNDGQITLQSVLDFQTWALEKGYLDTPVTEQQFWDPSFVEYANQVLEASSQ